MSTENTVTEYESALRDLLEHRMATGRGLATAAAHVATVRAQLEQAERDYAAAFAGAVSAGWTETELRKVFKSVNVTAPTRPRRTKSTGVRAQTPPPAAPVVSSYANHAHDNEPVEAISA